VARGPAPPRPRISGPPAPRGGPRAPSGAPRAPNPNMPRSNPASNARAVRPAKKRSDMPKPAPKQGAILSFAE
jgi:hypothetical protein